MQTPRSSSKFSTRDSQGALGGHRVTTVAPTISRRTIKVFIGVALLSLALSLAAVAMAAYNMSSRSFNSVTVKHLTVTPDEKSSEGILVRYEGKDTDFVSEAAGVRVEMPTAASVGSSQQAGLHVVGGQYSLRGDTPNTAAVFADQPKTFAFSSRGATSGSILANNNVPIV